MSPLSIVLIAAFTWRTAYLLTSEDGPFLISLKFRQYFPLGGLTTCVKCASVWTAALGFLLWRFGGDMGQAVVAIGALSGLALMAAAYSGASHV